MGTAGLTREQKAENCQRDHHFREKRTKGPLWLFWQNEKVNLRAQGLRGSPSWVTTSVQDTVGIFPMTPAEGAAVGPAFIATPLHQLLKTYLHLCIS